MGSLQTELQTQSRQTTFLLLLLENTTRHHHLMRQKQPPSVVYLVQKMGSMAKQDLFQMCLLYWFIRDSQASPGRSTIRIHQGGFTWRPMGSIRRHLTIINC